MVSPAIYRNWRFTGRVRGKHGWFWRNRGSETITIQLDTNGDYLNIKRVI
jgi:hypothetical protein